MSNTHWTTRGSSYYASSTTNTLPKLPPGVYKFHAPPMGSPFFELVGANFPMPKKLYGNVDTQVSRIVKAFDGLGQNLGVHLDGTKGAGKTVIAKMTCNAFIEKGFPVLLVDHPMAIAEVMAMADTQMVCFFDEFEKTHPKKEDQNSLLSTLDGVKTSHGANLFLFTTNEGLSTTYMENRPGRVRYRWTFDRLNPDVVFEVVMDILENKEHAKATVDYLLRREVLTIDVVTAVCREVNIFNEPPEAFKDFFALDELPPPSYNLKFMLGGKEVFRISRINTLPEDLLDRLQGRDGDGLLRKDGLRHHGDLTYTTLTDEEGKQHVYGVLHQNRPVSVGTPRHQYLVPDSEGRPTWIENFDKYSALTECPETLTEVVLEEVKADLGKFHMRWDLR